MAAMRARLLPFTCLPRLQHRSAFAAENRHRSPPIGDPIGSDCPNPNLFGFGIVPENGGNALPVPELDSLAEIHARNRFGDHFWRKAEGNQQRLKISSQALANDP